ncbi:MAG: DUF6048 family protein [Paludibacteraceae bacterium]
MWIFFPASGRRKNDTTKIPLYQGFIVEWDAVPLLEGTLNGRVTYGVQGNIQFNLKQTYFPVIEIGYGAADKTLPNQDATRFMGKGLYEKIGIDFNLLKQKPDSKAYGNFFLAGLRLGTTHFKYDMTNLSVGDGNYWGDPQAINVNSSTSTKFWYEFVAGIRVDVYKGIMMGWNIRNKHLLGGVSTDGKIAPWYIPGYGKNTNSLWGFSYVIGYRFK